jgi:predicted MFS family arabinose efflux permease
MVRTMHVWLLGFGLLVALILGVSLSPLVGIIAMFLWGFAVLPFGVLWAVNRASPPTDAQLRERDIGYWRNSRWQSGPH